MRALFRSVAFAFLVLTLPAQAARQALPADQIKINELVSETQKSSASTSIIDMVWWIPPQFWSSVLHDRKGDPKVQKEFETLFGKYTVVAAVRGSLGALGPEGFLSESELRAQIHLQGADGTRYAPLDAEQLDPHLAMLIQMMQPMFSSMLGQLGSNVHFFAFPAVDKGRPIADPLGDGHLVVEVAQDRYAFRLPLGSLLIPQRDPQSGDVFPGSYRFNPYTGTALQPAPIAPSQTTATQ